jgi:hypothetical protein
MALHTSRMLGKFAYCLLDDCLGLYVCVHVYTLHTCECKGWLRSLIKEVERKPQSWCPSEFELSSALFQAPWTGHPLVVGCAEPGGPRLNPTLQGMLG